MKATYESKKRQRPLARRARMALILDRDGSRCIWCQRDVDIGHVPATTEHLIPKSKGGPSWVENEVAACRRCNGRRGHQTVGQWLQVCEQEGWQPDIAFLAHRLRALQAAIEERGGQRRARASIESALRRLAREHRVQSGHDGTGEDER